MKKLFVIMTLVLCMVLTALPVFAENGAQQQMIVVKSAKFGCNFQFPYDVEDFNLVKCIKTKTCYPIFLAERPLCATYDNTELDFLNDGQPVDWFEVSDRWQNDYELIAEKWLSLGKLPKGYQAVNPLGLNSGWVDLQVPQYTVSKPSNIGALEDTMKLAKKAYDENLAAIEAAKKAEEWATVADLAAQTEGLKNAYDAAKKAFDEANKGVVEIKMVDAKGIVIVVEKNAIELTIKHHISFNGKESVLTETKSVPVVSEITKEAANKFALVSAVMDQKEVAVTLNADATKVSALQEHSDVVYGKVQKYVGTIDLYYVAGKAANDNEKVDAAKNAKTDANVAAATSAKTLPNTGVAETLPMLSAALLIVAGLFVAKKH